MIRCVWCGWEGQKKELDFDEHDVPRYCPVCGGQQFQKKEKVKKDEPKLVKAPVRKR